MRILMVSSLWPPKMLGGAELYAAELAGRLRARGHEVGVFTLGVDGEHVVARASAWPYPMDRFGEQPASRRALFHLRDLYNPSTRAQLGRALREFGPDVVHSHSIQGLSSVALTLPAATGVPQVHTIHDYWLLCQRASMVNREGVACATQCRPCKLISRARNELTRRHPPAVVTAVSEAVGREHTSRLPWLAARLRVVYNPVELAPVHPTRPKESARPPVFGYLGRLAVYKGVATLLDAFAGARVEGARLRVAGAGPLASGTRATPAGVEYVGWVAGEARDDFFTSLSCLVVPSEWKDPAPLVVNEAQSRGIPVIGARIGGIPELVRPECEPLLFSAGDVAELRARLEVFAEDPARYTPGAPSTSLAWPAHLDHIEAAYADAMASQREPPR